MKKTVIVHGLTVTVENPKGSVRAGVGPNGSWQTEMRHDYGDLTGPQLGADGDPVDVFLGDSPQSTGVYVVNQVRPDGTFDEHKVMLGFDGPDEAASAYLANYEVGWTGMGSVAAMDVGAFASWLHTGDLTQPAPASVPDANAARSTDHAPLSDAILSETTLIDAILVGPDGDMGYEVLTDAQAPTGFRRVKILAAPVGAMNENGRYYTREFLQDSCDAANAYLDASPRYGEEPHPRFNPSTGQFDTDSTREVWRMHRWLTDAAGDLWAAVDVDTTTPKGQRVNTKIDRREKLGVSVRWNWRNLLLSGRRLADIPRGRLTDGTEVTLFDRRMRGLVFPGELDSVPNPAATAAGRVLLDAAEGFVPMTDLTLPLTHVALADAAPPAQDAAPPALTTDPSAPPPEPPKTPTPKEKKPMTPDELRRKAAAASDPDTRQTLLDAAQALEDAPSAAAPAVDIEKLKSELLDSIAPHLERANKAVEIVDAKDAQDKQAAEQTKIQQLVDAVEKGDAPEVTRFTDVETRRELAESVRKAKTLEEGHAALLDAIAMTDRMDARLSLRLKGLDGGAGGAGGTATVDNTTRTQVLEDEGDKKVSEVEARLLDSIDAALVRLGGTVDKKLYKRNEAFALRVIDPLFSKVGAQAMVDSAEYLLAPKGAKSSTQARRAMQGLVDAHFLPQDFTLTDAAVNTGNLLQQPLVTRIILQRYYQMQQALSFMTGFDPSQGGENQNGFAGGRVGGTYNLGRNFRFQTRYFVQPPHSTGGMSRKSLLVSEGKGISQSGMKNQWQTFHTSPRRLSFALTRDVQVAVQTGTVPFDLTGTNIAENLAFFSRETDQLGYLEMVTNALETNCLPAATETVAAGNIANGNTQDGLVYGNGSKGNAAVVAVVQIAPVTNGVPYSSGAAPIQGAGPTTSVSPAFRTPVVMPRDVVGTGDSGVETVTTLYPIVVKKGAAVLTQGVLNADREIIPDNTGDPGNPSATPDYAVDYVRGKILFTANPGVSNATANLTLSYFYATNFYLTQINFAGGNYPNGQTDKEFFDTLYHRNDAIWALMGSYPNFMAPNVALGSLNCSRRFTEAQLFDRLRLPADTDLINPTGSVYASRHDIEYHQFNAPSILGDDAQLLMRNGTSVFAVDDPLAVEGGFTGYDANGLLTGTSLYKMQQFDTFCTPMGRNADTNAVFNPPSALHIFW